MNAIGLPEILAILLLFAAVVIIPAVICTFLFLTFRRIPPAYRALDPGLVWLLMIPCFAFFWTEARPDGYTIVSYGKDGIPDGCAPGVTRDLNDDICYSAGGFTRYPAGAFRPPPPAAPSPAPPGGS